MISAHCNLIVLHELPSPERSNEPGPLAAICLKELEPDSDAEVEPMWTFRKPTTFLTDNRGRLQWLHYNSGHSTEV